MVYTHGKKEYTLKNDRVFNSTVCGVKTMFILWPYSLEWHEKFNLHEKSQTITVV